MWIDKNVNKSNFKRKSCGAKKRFRDRQQAKAAVSRIRTVSKFMRYYKCDICQGYHLASERD